jgi:hypothetical protein
MFFASSLCPLRCRAIGQRCPGSPQSCPGVSRIIGPICINHGKQDESGWIIRMNQEPKWPNGCAKTGKKTLQLLQGDLAQFAELLEFQPAQPRGGPPGPLKSGVSDMEPVDQWWNMVELCKNEEKWTVLMEYNAIQVPSSGFNVLDFLSNTEKSQFFKRR